MGLTNDERGWLLTVLSGVACVFGASFICVDLLVRRIPGKQNFRIQDSDTFLSISLSLSSGVMLYSSLYNMLPSAKKSLQEGGFGSKGASWILIACFLGGVVVIQVLSRVLHSFMPSHVVDCEHSHDEGEEEEAGTTGGDSPKHGHENGHARPAMSGRPRTSSLLGRISAAPRAQKPVARHSSYFSNNTVGGSFAPTRETETNGNVLEAQPEAPSRRPSLQQRLTTGIAQLAAKPKPKCDCDGPCFGFSDVCGSECFKNVSARGGSKASFRSTIHGAVRPSVNKSATAATLQPCERTSLLNDTIEEHPTTTTASSSRTPSPSRHRTSDEETLNTEGTHTDLHKTSSHASHTTPETHHHHVPTNAFLSLSLQTSLAIALHKLPEGFITYFTNHASPHLGFSLFLALSIHNITEGFALALPLYLALQSRPKAMAWSFALGGLSQPLGAGVAALGLWYGEGGGEGQGMERVQGGIFAATAGIMACVALQLFGEAGELTHSRGLCVVGAFVGMGVLGVCGALTA